jgi:hypothetical protein
MKKSAKGRDSTRNTAKNKVSKRGPIQDLEVRDRGQVKGGLSKHIPPPC